MIDYLLDSTTTELAEREPLISIFQSIFAIEVGLGICSGNDLHPIECDCRDDFEVRALRDHYNSNGTIAIVLEIPWGPYYKGVLPIMEKMRERFRTEYEYMEERL